MYVFAGRAQPLEHLEMVKRVLMPLAVAHDLPSVDIAFHLFFSTSEASF